MEKQNRKILLVGATGFVGQQIFRILSARKDVDVICYTRKHAEERLNTFAEKNGLAKPAIHVGNLEDSTELTQALETCDGLIYAASLGFDYAKDVVHCCEKAGIKRAIFMSTTAIFTKLNASSKKVRTAAEKRIIDSKLNWTILRPTMIFGRKGDRNMERLVAFIKKYAFIPVPGGGNSLMQPIHVDDVASAAVDAYFCNKAKKRAYNISGAEALTFKSVIQTTSQLLDKRTIIIPIPLAPSRFMLCAFEKLCALLRIKPKLKEEQLLRLNENKDFSHTDASNDFNFAPITFKAGVSGLIKELKK